MFLKINTFCLLISLDDLLRITLSFWIHFIKLSISVRHLYQEYVSFGPRWGAAKSHTAACHQGAKEFPNFLFSGKCDI